VGAPSAARTPDATSVARLRWLCEGRASPMAGRDDSTEMKPNGERADVDRRTEPKPDLAQAGTLAAAILAALVSADPFDARNRASWVRYGDYLAIALWIGAVVLFLVAGATQDGVARQRGWRSLSTSYRAALGMAGLAGLITIGAIAVVPFDISEDHDMVAVRLTIPTEGAISALCGIPVSPLIGEIPTRTLSEKFVTVALTTPTPTPTSSVPPTPTTRRPCDAIRIPVSAVLGLQEHPYK